MVFIDTAGRLQIDEDMMDELCEIKKAVNPTEILLVVDSILVRITPVTSSFSLKVLATSTAT